MPAFGAAEQLRNESVITITGEVRARSEDTVNKTLSTGEIEVQIAALELQSAADTLPLQVNSDEDSGEDVRLRYRYLDLRRQRPHANIMLARKDYPIYSPAHGWAWFYRISDTDFDSLLRKARVIFWYPARLHPGKFYALPQAPQQFKQLIMVSGFDKYFQIAPCFRDEDSRADRSPGEFYQLDLEMSFVEQADVFAAVEPVVKGVFDEFSDKKVDPDFVHIPFDEAMLKYGSDKPDLRIPLEICDVTKFSVAPIFLFLRKILKKGSGASCARPKCGSRAIADRMNSWAQGEGAPGMGYIIYGDGEARGPWPKRWAQKKPKRLNNSLVLQMAMRYFLHVRLHLKRPALLVRHGCASVRNRI